MLRFEYNESRVFDLLNEPNLQRTSQFFTCLPELALFNWADNEISLPESFHKMFYFIRPWEIQLQLLF